MHHSPFLHWFATTAGAIAWSALVLQLFLSVQTATGEGGTVLQGVVTYFGYFTILTNLAGAMVLSIPRWVPSSAAAPFRQPGTVTAVTASILLVGIAYFLLLRQVWDPQGLHQLSTVALHYITPPLLLGYWWLAVPKGQLHWQDIPLWSLYPISYLIYILIRGEVLQDYPYPFMDVDRLGYGQVLLNALGLLLAFVAIAFLLITAGRSLQKGT